LKILTVHEISEKFADKMKKKHNYTQDEKEVISYYAEVFISTLNFLVSSFIISLLLFGLIGVLYCAIVAITFGLLRRNTGGYHCLKPLPCYILTSSSFIVTTILAVILSTNYFIYILYLISLICGIGIIKLVPVPSENSPSRGKKIDDKFRKKYVALLIVFIVINIINIILGMTIISNCISLAIILVAILTSKIPLKISKLKPLSIFKKIWRY